MIKFKVGGIQDCKEESLVKNCVLKIGVYQAATALCLRLLSNVIGFSCSPQVNAAHPVSGGGFTNRLGCTLSTVQTSYIRAV